MAVEGIGPLVVVCVACIGQGALFAPELWRCRRIWPRWNLWKFWLKEQDSQNDPVIAAEISDRLCSAVRAAANTAGMFWFVYCLVYVSLPDTGSWLTELQHHSLMVCNFSVLCLRLCPKRALRHSLPLWYMWFMAWTSTFVYFADTSNVFAPLRSIAIANVCRIAATFVFGKVGVSIACNAVVACVNTYVVSAVQDESRDELGGTFSTLAFEGIVTSAIVAFAWHHRMSLDRECSQKVKNQRMSIEASAMTALLGLVCDVVVELDESLHVVEHAPKLSAMLAINRSTQGMPLMRYMLHDFDRDRFEQKVRRSDVSGSSCAACEQGAMHVTLHDSMNNAIPAEIFYVTFQSPGNKTSCFAGIREIADQPIARLKSSRRHGKLELPRSAPGAGSESALVGHEGHGTSPVTESHSLDEAHDPPDTEASTTPDEDTSSASSACSDLATRWTPVDERFAVTTVLAKKLAVLEMVMQWNIKMPKRSCCPFHAEINDLRSLLRNLAPTKCNKDFRLSGDHQCAGCGLVLYVDDAEANLEHCRGKPLRYIPRRQPDESREQLESSRPAQVLIGL